MLVRHTLQHKENGTFWIKIASSVNSLEGDSFDIVNLRSSFNLVYHFFFPSLFLGRFSFLLSYSDFFFTFFTLTCSLNSIFKATHFDYSPSFHLHFSPWFLLSFDFTVLFYWISSLFFFSPIYFSFLFHFAASV